MRMKKIFARCKFVPIILCLLSLGLLCSSAVAKGAVVEKANGGQYTLNCEAIVVPQTGAIVLPDIAGAPSTTIISTAPAKIADVALTSPTSFTTKTETATSSPPVHDLQRAITYDAVIASHAVTHQYGSFVLRA